MPGHPASRPYRVEVPLRWSDMDAYGHVNNVQYLRLLEDARVVGFQEWFPDRPTLVDEGIVVSRHVIEYRAPLTYRPAPVEVDMWVTRVHGAGFDLGYVVRDPEPGGSRSMPSPRPGWCSTTSRPPVPAACRREAREQLSAHQGDRVSFRWSGR